MEKRFKNIREYWKPKIYEGDMGWDWADAHNHCWRCGKKTSHLEKCHIIAEQFGGKKTPDNLVILCNSCHKEAPDFNQTDKMWNWIKNTSTTFYAEFLSKRVKKEYEDMTGENLFDKFKSLIDNKFTETDILNVVKKHMHKIGFHGGNVSYSTYACLLENVIEELEQKNKIALDINEYNQ